MNPRPILLTGLVAVVLFGCPAKEATRDVLIDGTVQDTAEDFVNVDDMNQHERSELPHETVDDLEMEDYPQEGQAPIGPRMAVMPLAVSFMPDTTTRALTIRNDGDLAFHVMSFELSETPIPEEDGFFSYLLNQAPTTFGSYEIAPNDSIVATLMLSQTGVRPGNLSGVFTIRTDILENDVVEVPLTINHY